MAIVPKSAESDASSPPRSPPSEQPTTPRDLKTFDETTTCVDFAVYKARLYQNTIQAAVESAFHDFKSRFSQIQSTSSAHFQQTSGALQDVVSDYVSYEDFLLKVKGPRQFVYNNTLRLFVSEEALIARAEAKLKALRQSIDLLKAASEKLEKGASQGEAEFLRGRTKLRQAGKQIQGVIHSAYKIERQAGGLKDILAELPRIEATRFQTQVYELAKEAKRERNILTKQVAKISSHH